MSAVSVINRVELRVCNGNWSVLLATRWECDYLTAAQAQHFCLQLVILIKTVFVFLAANFTPFQLTTYGELNSIKTVAQQQKQHNIW